VLAALVLPATAFASQTHVGCRLSDPFLQRGGVYCFMRQSGNDMRVSWTAAIALDQTAERQPVQDIASGTGPGDEYEAWSTIPGAFPDCAATWGLLFRSEQEAPPDPAGTADNSAFAEGPMAIPSGGTTKGMIATTIEIRSAVDSVPCGFW